MSDLVLMAPGSTLPKGPNDKNPVAKFADHDGRADKPEPKPEPTPAPKPVTETPKAPSAK